MAEMICPQCGYEGGPGVTMCPEDMEPLVPAETQAEPELATRLDPATGPGVAAGAGHAAATLLRLHFPWGEVPVGEAELPVGRSRRASPLATHITDTAYGNVSRRHAVLWREGPRLFVRDVGSVNGTFVNEKRLPDRTPHELRAGDQLRFAADLTATVVDPAEGLPH